MQHLINALLATLLGLPIGCFIGGLAIGGYAFLTEPGNLSTFQEAFGTGFSIALFALVIGILPGVVYGAPVYALLSSRQCANTWTTLVVGVLPGLIFLPSQPGMATFAIVFGICISLSTHRIALYRIKKIRASEGYGRQ